MQLLQAHGCGTHYWETTVGLNSVTVGNTLIAALGHRKNNVGRDPNFKKKNSNNNWVSDNSWVKRVRKEVCWDNNSCRRGLAVYEKAVTSWRDKEVRVNWAERTSVVLMELSGAVVFRSVSSQDAWSGAVPERTIPNTDRGVLLSVTMLRDSHGNPSYGPSWLHFNRQRFVSSQHDKRGDKVTTAVALSAEVHSAEVAGFKVQSWGSNADWINSVLVYTAGLP